MEYKVKLLIQIIILKKRANDGFCYSCEDNGTSEQVDLLMIIYIFLINICLNIDNKSMFFY